MTGSVGNGGIYAEKAAELSQNCTHDYLTKYCSWSSPLIFSDYDQDQLPVSSYVYMFR